MRYFLFSMIMMALALVGCSSGRQQNAGEGRLQVEDKQEAKPAADFCADSARAFVVEQCAFGPRVPGSEAHRLCGDYLAGKLRQYGASVIEQRMSLTTFDGTMIPARNIIGEYNPDASRRLLLLAHWDCRPWADNDPDPARRRDPVPGANDGASGVAVLLEVARQLAAAKPSIGVDILLVDAEDWGDSGAGNDDTWALGTQYWTANPHRPGYRPMYGILLDMVGAGGAVFAREYFSTHYARGFVDEVWKTARTAGYGDYFVDTPGGAVTDDHLFVNRAGIPCIDIIDQTDATGTGFFRQWHTTADTPDIIDSASLKAVGQTVLNVIYSY